MDPYNPTEPELAKIFEKSKIIAVVGLSRDPEKDSHGVASYLQKQGYRIVPVNPNAEGEILGEQVYPHLASVPLTVGVVDIFRPRWEVPGIVDAAIAKGARTVWMQLGIEHLEAAAKAQAAGLKVVMDHCIGVEHRLFIALRSERSRTNPA